MPKAKKQKRPPPPDSDPAQSVRFVKDAAELMSADGAQLYERAMETLAQPVQLIARPEKAIMIRPRVAKKKAAGVRGKGR